MTVVTDHLDNSPCPVVFATIVGSKGFGYATEQSDLDIHGVHLLSLESVLGFDPGANETIQRKVLATDEHPQLEISTHDLRKFCRLMVKGNGNVLEDVLSPLVLKSSPLHERLKELTPGCFTKKCANHYLGMAKNQQHNLANNGVKKLLHMYRCYLTGIHLMATGTLEICLPVLAEWYGERVLLFDVMQAKQEGRFFDTIEMEFHLRRLENMVELLENERDRSQLPDQIAPTMVKELERLVIETRLSEIP